MFREKLIATLVVASAVIGAAMLVDFLITIVVLRNYSAYTPLITFSIGAIVAFPVTYGLISSRFNLRLARDALGRARDAAEDAKKETLQALRAVEVARRKAEEDRAAAIEASRAKSEFLANMSHELRTPLNAILGFSEMLASHAFAEKRAEYALLIHSSGSHLLGLVDDLLDLSRIEANKLDLRDEMLDVGALIRGCVEVVEPRAAERRLALVCHVQANLPPVVADRRALTQILLNLLSNAIKFSEEGKPIVVFASVAPDGGLSFGVRDEGTGIPEGEQARMFERFGQGRHDVSYTAKGAGLGLPIVKGLAEAHRGRVAMESTLGEGTCITVWLPPERVMAHSQTTAA